jgi:hypothetical protein
VNVSMSTDSYVLAGGVAIIIACGLGIVALLFSSERSRSRRFPQPLRLDGERDIAAALGRSWRSWVLLRAVSVLAAIVVGVVSGVWLLSVLLVVAALGGIRFLVAGRAAKRALARDREFIAMIRELRDRMAVSNQSLDTALLEIAAQPPRLLESVLAPLRQGGLIGDSLAACAIRSRSPIQEQACGVLMWARSRSLDALISTIDTVLLPVADAQLAVEEEAMVTLTQQRAVSMAMAVLMLVMFLSVARVGSFRAYYQSPAGTVVVTVVVAMFCGLVAAVNRLARPTRWTRWNMAALAEAERQNLA